MDDHRDPKEFPARENGRELSALQLRILRAVADQAHADGRASTDLHTLATLAGVSEGELRDELRSFPSRA